MLCSSRLSISFSRAHLCRIAVSLCTFAVCKSTSRSLTCSRELPAVAGIAEDEIFRRGSFRGVSQLRHQITNLLLVSKCG